MKRLFQTLTLPLLFVSSSFVVSACTCVEHFRKDFRKAKTVFVGKVIDIKGDSTIEGYRAIVRLEVEKVWKGSKQKVISIYASEPNFNTGMCGSFGFEKGKKYLVFAFTEKLLVHTECSSNWEFGENPKYPQNIEYQQNLLKRLDNFWFRTWARLNPL